MASSQIANVQAAAEDSEQQIPQQPVHTGPVELPGVSTPEAELLHAIVDETTKRQLLESIVERRRFQDSRAMASYFAQSGFFKDAQSLAQAFTKIELGKSWGLNAAESMKSVVIVNARPFCQNDAVASRLAAKGWSWKVQWLGAPPPKTTGCRLHLRLNGQPFLNEDGSPVTVEFTLDMAGSITVFEGGARIPLNKKKGPWSDGWAWKMCYWKCIGLIRDFYAPDVLSGAQMQSDAPEMEFEPIEEIHVDKEPRRMSERKAVEVQQNEPSSLSSDSGLRKGANPRITTDQVNELITACMGLNDDQITEIVKLAGAERIDHIQVSVFASALKMAKEMKRG